MEYDDTFVLDTFSSPFIDDDLFEAHFDGKKNERDAVNRYLTHPVNARPDISWFFDRDYYLEKYPDIQAAGIDPLIHFMRWGVTELRSPHPLINLRYIHEIDSELLSEEPTIDVLHTLLSRDLVNPSALFSLDYYRCQLDDDVDPNLGLVGHFVKTGLLAGLRSHPSFDPVAAYCFDHARTFDVRSGLRHLALSNRALNDGKLLPTADHAREADAKLLFREKAAVLLSTFGRHPLRFDLKESPNISVIMVLHNNFALTLQALASLRQSYAGAIQLVLVDSGSSDETRNIAGYVTGADLLRFEDNIGYLLGCNAGLDLASADFVLYMNNDVELAPGALAAAIDRLHSHPCIGAVGGKIIRSHGALQEAGCIVWRDGWTIGYLRDQSPLCPEANFVRDVDFCSAVFLLVRANVVRGCGGFDEAFAPAYYEDVDLCFQVRNAGFRVVYDPSVVVHHLEYGSANAAAEAHTQIDLAHKTFFRKHLNTLRSRYIADRRAQVFARSVGKPRGRVLFIEDQVPLRRMGSGFVRSNDIIQAMAEMGFQVTVFPVIRSAFHLSSIYADLPDTVEVMYDRDLAALETFLIERRGTFDTIWIARTHNLDRVKPILERLGIDVLSDVRVVLDTEAIAATRTAYRYALQRCDAAFDEQGAIQAEFANAYFSQSIVAVNEQEAQILRDQGLSDVQVLGHTRGLFMTPRPWKDRAGMLFIGSFAVEDSPNYDGLCWFVDEVLPLVEQELHHETRLTVVGLMGQGVDLGRFCRCGRVSYLGEVADTVPLYDSHRVFIAPTRYAAGVPYKVHEAASYGLPVVATELLRSQLGWEHNQEVLAAKPSDPAAFAQSIIELYRCEDLWRTIRRNAAERIQVTCGQDAYKRILSSILNETSNQ